MRSLMSCGFFCAMLVALAVLREEGHWPEFVFIACGFGVGVFAGILLMIRDKSKGKKAELRPSKHDKQVGDAIETYHIYVDDSTDD